MGIGCRLTPRQQMAFLPQLLRVVCLTLLVAGAANAGCNESIAELRGAWGTAKFNIEVADTPEMRAEGLMFRESLPASGGMLFVYEKPEHATFWMKNTSIPLDMIFFDFRGQVTAIHRDAIPHDTNLIDGGKEVSAVLEVNAGIASRLGIDVGSQIRHLSFDQQSAVWPCGTGQ